MTSFLDRLFGRPEPKTAKAVTALGAWGNGIPLSSLNDTPQKKAAACLRAYKVGWFYKAGRKIADDVSGLDWSVSDGDVEEGEAETTLDRPDLRVPFDSLSPIDQFQRLLERPNPSYTGRQLLRKTQVRLDFAGAACWYLENGTFGLPTAIYGISPARMWPSYDKAGNLLGWVMDKDSPSGGVPFDKAEILWFTTGNATDDEVWGTSVVEAVYSQVPLTDLMARHTANVLTTGGRLAGMLWPKERALTEDEFVDAQRAWRNVASDPDAGKRLLIFPEPMEYASGASTPAEIGIPELAVLSRDEILTAFSLSPYQLGVPMPGGLNGAETRREDRRDYWEGTIHPRADLLEETIQVGLLSRYEDVLGQTLDFEIAEPNLDSATSLLEKAGAFRALVGIGFAAEETVKAVGLGHIKWDGLPLMLDPEHQAEMQTAQLESTVSDTTNQDSSQTRQAVVDKPKPPVPAKSRDGVADTSQPRIAAFLAEQRDRVITAIRETYPIKSARREWATKSDPDWWDRQREDEELAKTLRVTYVEAGRDGLQAVADRLGRIVPNKTVDRIVTDLSSYGGARIKDINERTLQRLTIELAEGTRRGYSISQLIDGVPEEGFKGILGVGLENGVGVWDGYRAEVISRTETALSYNRASLRAYDEFGVRTVLAYDGDGDEQCASRNGREYPVAEALMLEDHPNGTLDWAPVLDKAWHEPAPAPVQPVTVNLTIANHTEPGKTPDVKVYNDVAAMKAPDVIVNVPEQAPQVTVPVSVEAPVVNVKAPPAPVVHVAAAEAPVVGD